MWLELFCRNWLPVLVFHLIFPKSMVGVFKKSPGTVPSSCCPQSISAVRDRSWDGAVGCQDPLPSAGSVLRGQTLGQDRTPDRSAPRLGLASSDPVIGCQKVPGCGRAGTSCSSLGFRPATDRLWSVPAGKDRTIVVQREAIKAPELIFLQGRKQAGHPSWFPPKLALKSMTVFSQELLVFFLF